MPNGIKHFVAGTQASASHLNEMVDAINAFLSLAGDGLIQVANSNGRASVGLNLGMLLERIGRTAKGVFPVVVEKDGGVAGSDAAECTWTYTVKDLNANTLSTAVTPETPRLHYVAYWYAGETRTAPAVATSTYGLACYSAAGTLILLTCFGEIAKEDVCP